MAHDARSSKPANLEKVAEPAPRDIVLVHSPTEDGKGARVIRVRDQTIETGEVRPLEDGKPISGEVVKLTPRGENARVCDVETLVPAQQTQAAALPPSSSAPRKGPAQVATDDFRDNWGRIFGTKPPDSTLN